MSLDVDFNSNITICAEDLSTSNQYGELLAKALERWFPDSCILVTEKDLYEI